MFVEYEVLAGYKSARFIAFIKASVGCVSVSVLFIVNSVSKRKQCGAKFSRLTRLRIYFDQIAELLSEERNTKTIWGFFCSCFEVFDNELTKHLSSS